MCGIFLYLSKNNIYEKSLKFREKIFKNFSKIQHRGPDNSTFINVNDKLIFGFHRLAIVDKSIQGNQPFISYKNELDTSSEPVIYCMCNGEIYNYKQLILEYNLNVLTQGSSHISFVATGKPDHGVTPSPILNVTGS